MSTPNANILIVDDTIANLQLLSAILEEAGYEVRPAQSGKMALQAAKLNPPDLVLLDINMPEVNGYEVCLAFKADPDLESIPIIFISAMNEVNDKVMAFRVGGVDYISKPFHAQEVLARVSTHLELRWKQWELQRLHEWEHDYWQQANQLKDDILRMVSHDLKNPLTNILGSAYILSQQVADQPDLIHLTDLIERNAERMQNLVTRVLDLTHLEGSPDLTLETVALNPFLQAVLDDFLFAAKEKPIALAFNPSPDAITLRAAPDRLSQVFHNLLSNAIKYTPAGGTVTMSSQMKAGQAWVKIEDTGLGIPAEALPRIFDRFYRVQTPEHLKESGTGLGMAIVKVIVEQHQGKIWVESELGKGTCFRVSLPLPKE
jgi:signal transduction histidine kinase